jgi:hypothetical protein
MGPSGFRIETLKDVLLHKRLAVDKLNEAAENVDRL